ncbi:MAG: glycosyltransferase family 39 protein [Clostridia bacterium]|nr:glycosyltransferase family 39 protein [Clostridia bacterium]
MATFSIWIKRLFSLCFLFCLLAMTVMHGIGLGILLILAAIFIPRKFHIRHFPLLLFVVSTIVHFAAVFCIRPEPIQDFATMYDAAQQAAAGDFSFQNTQYFYLWAYQTGFVLWEALLLKLFGHAAVIKIVHALMLSGINCMIYLLARRFTNERAAQTASLLYLVTLFPTVLNCLLTNQVVSAFFLLLGICILTSGKEHAFSIPRALIAGLLFALGNIMRPEGIVILAALAGTAVFVVIMKRSIKQNKQMLLGIVLAAIVYAVCNAGASYAISASGINQYGLSNNWPTWKFIISFNQESGGMYSAADRELFGNAHRIDTPEAVREASVAAEKALILDRICIPPVQMVSLLAAKVSNLWLQTGLGFPMGYLNDTSVSICHIAGPKFYQYCVLLDRVVFLFSLACALLGGLSLMRRKPEEQTFSTVLAPMTVMACFAVFLLVEVQPRYAFLPQIFLYITAAAGIAQLFSLLREHTEKPVEMLTEAPGTEENT